MSRIGFSERFFETTRGRVVELLRGGSQTVDELAARLALTDNAVRVHLAALERDGIVREEGVRRAGGVGKPATLYGIAPEAQPAFSRAYIPFLQTLLAALADDMPRERLHRLMREIGQRLARSVTSHPADVRDRVALAAALLDELGGVTTVVEERDALRICGAGCPLSAVVAGQPEVCAAVTTMVSEIVEADVVERCERDGHPRCGFEVAVRRRK